MNDVAFVDSSPLILLAAIGRADLLRCVANRVVVPESVRTEILADVGDRLTPIALRSAWIEVGADPAAPATISAWDLGSGETSVLALAAGTPRSVAVIDDLAARHCAIAMGITLIGSVGVVVRARRRGLIGAARPVVEDLRAAGLWLSDDLAERVLREVGE